MTLLRGLIARLAHGRERERGERPVTERCVARGGLIDSREEWGAVSCTI